MGLGEKKKTEKNQRKKEEKPNRHTIRGEGKGLYSRGRELAEGR